MRNKYIAIACLAGMTFAPAVVGAQTAVDPGQPTATDVVTKPLSDMNIKKDEIPPILLTARDRPYDMAGLRTCPAIQAEVRKLDAVLGDDIDVAEPGKGGLQVGRLAQSVVGSLIPFGGVIREISGANEQQRQWNVALYAGSVRRGYLKGMGQQKGCRYPARAASTADAAAHSANASHDAKAETPRKTPAKKTKSGKGVRFESKPVVQPAKK
jgi:hypothetical protein